MTAQQTQARNRTARQVEALNREVLATYDDALKAINRDLQKVYARYLDGVAAADRYNVMIQYGRLQKLQAEIAAEYAAFSKKAGIQIRESSRLAMSNSYYYEQFVLDFFSPNAGIDLSFSMLPKELLETAVTGNIARWNELGKAARDNITAQYGPINRYVPNSGTLTDTLLANRRRELLALNRTINSGLVRGVSYSETARDVRRVIGTSKSNAERIVRTEGNRTLNAGAYANSHQAAEQGLPLERQWVATLDSRTRDRHAELDGQRVPVDGEFKMGGDSAAYPGEFGDSGMNINCRCTVIDIVDGISPVARRGVNPVTGKSEVFEWKTYEQWAKDNGLKQLPSGRLG